PSRVSVANGNQIFGTTAVETGKTDSEPALQTFGAVTVRHPQPHTGRLLTTSEQGGASSQGKKAESLTVSRGNLNAAPASSHSFLTDDVHSPLRSPHHDPPVNGNPTLPRER
ncbi:hypothetical protein KUCAC02_022493, partial [Chaenocephalus aceratus]